MLAIVALACVSHRAQAGWYSVGQLNPIYNFFDAGNDAFEADAYPSLAVTALGWNTAWTTGTNAGQYVFGTVINDAPLNGGDNYLDVTISNATSAVAIRRQYTPYLAPAGGGYNFQTYNVNFVPHRVKFDVRLNAATNALGFTNSWTSRTDNFFIHAANQTRTSPNTDDAWAIFVQGGESRVQDPYGPANRWLYYDGSPIRTDLGAGTYVDSGMNFYFGVVYHFEVITDPRDKTYTVTVSDNTGTNATYTSGVLRWRSYGDVTVVSSRNFLTFGGACTDAFSVMNFSIDSIVSENIPPTVFPPLVTQLKPNVRAPFTLPVTNVANNATPYTFTPDYDTTEFWPASRGISFVAQTAGGGSNDYSGGFTGLMATAETTIPVSGIGLVLNGSDVTGSLSISGPANFRKVAYSGLVPNMTYTGLISITNSAGAVKQQRLEFNTFDEAFVRYIEAEDYNYSDGSFGRDGSFSLPTVGGNFIEDPLPSDYVLANFYTPAFYINQSGGYVDRVGWTNADFSDTTLTVSNAVNNAYRFGDPVGTTPTLDFRRAKYNLSGARDFQVSLMQPNEWLNYTRTFAAGTYKLYLRASSTRTTVPNDQFVNLDLVTSDPTQQNQTTNNLGSFLVPYTGNAAVFTNVPLIETNGNTEITVNLSGLTTLRLTALNAGNNLQLNYLLVVPATTNAPTVAVATPVDGAAFAPGATVALTATASAGVASVEYFNGTVSLGSSGTSPFLVNWTSVPTGRYSITAKATSTSGFKSSSAPVNITVGSPAKKVLFVIGVVFGQSGAVDAGNTGSGDQFLRNYFASKGWVTTDLYAPNLARIGGMAATRGFDLVVISASVQSSDVQNFLRDTPVPVWNGESSIHAAMAWCKDNPSSIDYGAAGGNLYFQVRPNVVGLPGTAGLAAGNYQIAGLAGNGNRASSLNENAVRILCATNVPFSSTTFQWYYPRGAEMFNGIIAPATHYCWYSATIDSWITNPLNEIGTNLLNDGFNVLTANAGFTGVPIYLTPPVSGVGSVTVPFTASSTEVPADFSLWSSATVNGTYTVDNTAVITQVDPTGNKFEAATTASGDVRFYRVRRN